MKFKILGISYDNISFEEALQKSAALPAEKPGSNIFFVNIDCLYQAQRDREYAGILNSADLLLPDGIGLKVLTRAFSGRMVSNCNGTDFSPAFMRELADRGHSVFFLGGKDGVIEKAVKRILQLAPGLKVAGTHGGYFDDDQELISKINESQADILFVGLGVPYQEKFISKYREQLKPKLCLGVGALFDYLSQRIPRAPVVFRKMNIEWVWRILMEPQRMIKRYLLNDLPFMLLIMLKMQRSS